MLFQNKDLFIKKINDITNKILMPIMFVAILIYSTVFNDLSGGFPETLQNIIAILILLVIAANFIYNPKSIKEYISIYVVIYFVIRLITIASVNFEYVAIRSAFYEVFFLVGICKCTVGKNKNINFYFYTFILFEMIMNIMCLVTFFIAPKSDALYSALVTYTLYSERPTAAFFVNPNTAGIISAFSALLLFIYLSKEKNHRVKILYYVLIFFNLIFLVFQKCRSAEITLALIALLIVSKYIFKNINPKKITISILILCLLSIICIYGFINSNMDEFPKSINEKETIINVYGSGRYGIWKGCYIEQQDHLLLGAGSLSLEQDNRKNIIGKIENDYSQGMRDGIKFGPHNGYIGMISATGWLGFIAFMLVLLQKIKKSKLLKEGNWYLIVIFTLVVNLFESLFILNRFFLCFFMFMILEAEPDEESDKLLSC